MVCKESTQVLDIFFCTVIIQMLRLLFIVTTAQQPQSKGRHFRTFAAIQVHMCKGQYYYNIVNITIDKRSAQK